jgi:NAD(P)-dependent dehydrogenase (short-subunit alcohol dehydrogenase family)
MNKVAVVTGGAGGIGQAVANRLARENHAIVVLDMNQAAGDAVVNDFRTREIAVRFMQSDLTREEHVRDVFEKIRSDLGRIDVLVNVAGGSLHRHQLAEFPLAHWQAVIDANLTSTFLCCRAVVPTMTSQRTGALVNISSDIAFSGDADRSAYAAAKAGILGLTRSLALELAPTRVRVNAVAPGRIETPRVRSHYSDAEWAAAAKRIPLGHAGQPEDVAEVVAFLASDAAKHITGQTIHVNGGRIMT